MEVRRLVREQNGLSKRRLAYTLAAGAASVGMCESSTEAAISYSGLQNISIVQGFRQPINFDGDLNTDINLKNYVLGAGNYQGATAPFAPSKIVGFYKNGLYYVSALHAGDPINDATVGPSFLGSMAFGSVNPNAQFNNIDNAYVGVDFRINNGTDLYYGWIRVSINNAAGTFVVNDWAYEKTPGVGILAGATGPLGDFNKNGEIEAGDYVIWRKTDNTTDGYNAWRTNFGKSVPVSGAGLGVNAIPEPMTLGLFAAGSAGLALLRRTRRGKS